MKHCVAKLAKIAAAAAALAWVPLRNTKTLDRVATLAICGSDGAWEIVQLKGEQNSMPDERTIRASWGFLRCFEDSAPTPPTNEAYCQGSF